jgi:Xaa-Pro aminopeptidase
MKNSLSALMQKINLDAFIAFGSSSDPNFSYLTEGSDVGDGVFVMIRDEPAHIWVWFLDRENVKPQDLIVHQFDRSLYRQTFEKTDRSELADLEVYLQSMDILDSSIRRIAIYGRLEYSFSRLFQETVHLRYPDIEIVNDYSPNLIEQSRAIKTDSELERIIEVGRKTSLVMIETRDFIRIHKVNGNMFVKDDGSQLTVRDVKRFTRDQLLKHGLEDPDGAIFAPGIQGTAGHLSGKDETPIQLGEQIIFDLFPREPKGYYHDITRTWSFGYASNAMQKLYDDVFKCFQLVKNHTLPGVSGGTLQDIACDYFRQRGYPVVKDNPDTLDGYTHSLGHGVGLNVHEIPYMGINEKNTLAVGNVFALEPGLYDTKQGLAGRIEDTFYIDQHGQCIDITDVPYDLVIPIT